MRMLDQRSEPGILRTPCKCRPCLRLMTIQYGAACDAVFLPELLKNHAQCFRAQSPQSSAKYYGLPIFHVFVPFLLAPNHSARVRWRNLAFSNAQNRDNWWFVPLEVYIAFSSIMILRVHFKVQSYEKKKSRYSFMQTVYIMLHKSFLS